jgi:isoleucyl-tRNA synthetase
LPSKLFTIDEDQMRAGVLVGAEDGVTVALDSMRSEELLLEGLAREIVRHAQILRKDAGLRVEQRIVLGIEGGDPRIRDALSRFSDDIAAETLAADIQAALQAPVRTEKVRIEDTEVRLSLAPTGA